MKRRQRPGSRLVTALNLTLNAGSVFWSEGSWHRLSSYSYETRGRTRNNKMKKYSNSLDTAAPALGQSSKILYSQTITISSDFRYFAASLVATTVPICNKAPTPKAGFTGLGAAAAAAQDRPEGVSPGLTTTLCWRENAFVFSFMKKQDIY